MATRLGSLPTVVIAILALHGSAASAGEIPSRCNASRRDLLKVYTQVSLGVGVRITIGPQFISDDRQFVMRSAAELAANADPKKANDPEFQKQVEAHFAKLLKVDAIDWNKQMVVAVACRSDSYDRTSKVFFHSFAVRGKELAVNWAHTSEGKDLRRIDCHLPRGMALVERFDGPVLFNPPTPK